MVSILLLTIDRFKLAERCIGQSLANAGYPYELLVVDNGSIDEKIIEYVASLNPVYHRLNKENGGIARMNNQMMLRATGEYLCMLQNDMVMPPDWLRCLVETYEGIPQSGITSIHSVDELPSVRQVNGFRIYPSSHVLGGIAFFSRAFMDKVGYYDEEFHPYGYEDVVMHRRSEKAGYMNYFAGLGAQHLGPQPNQEPLVYSTMKTASVAALAARFSERIKKTEEGLFYTPPPLLG